MRRILVILLLAAALTGAAGEARAAGGDSFRGPTAITALPFSATGDTYGATTEPGEPVGCGLKRHTVWYRYTADSDGFVRLDVSGDFGVEVAAYEVTAGVPLEPAGCGESNEFPGQTAVFRAAAGTTYLIQVGGYEPVLDHYCAFYPCWGAYRLTVEAVPGVPNDDFADAKSISALPYTDALDPSAATAQTTEPSPACTPVAPTPARTVWYRFTPTTTRTLRASAAVERFSPSIAAYTGDTLATLTGVACGYQSVRVAVEAGQTYHFQVEPPEPGTRALSFSLEPEAPTSNDDFADATPLPSLAATVSGTLANASVDPGEPECYEGTNQAYAPASAVFPLELPSVWYRMPAVADPSAATVSVTGESEPFYADVFRGTSLANLNPVVCEPRDTFRLVPDETYYVRVTGVYHEPFVLTVTPAALPANDAFASAAPLTLGTSLGGNNEAASLESGEPAPACAVAPDASVWYRFSPATTEALVASVERAYTADVVTVYEGTDSGPLVPLGCATRRVASTLSLVPFASLVARDNQVRFVGEAGKTYYVQVAGDFGWTGDFEVGLRRAV